MAEGYGFQKIGEGLLGVTESPKVCPDPAVHGPHDIPTPVGTVFSCEGRKEVLPDSRVVVTRSEYEALRVRAAQDHDLMQSRIDNQKAIIDRLGKANKALRDQANDCPNCTVLP